MRSLSAAIFKKLSSLLPRRTYNMAHGSPVVPGWIPRVTHISKDGGFTALELILVIAIGAVLLPVIVTSIFQIIRGTDRSNSENIALATIDNASSWLSRDLALAQKTNLNPPDCSSSIRGEWLDETGPQWAGENPRHFVNYLLQDSTLRRKYGDVIDLSDVERSDTVVGQHITSISFCPPSGTNNFITVNITSRSGDTDPQTKTLLFYSSPRPEKFLP